MKKLLIAGILFFAIASKVSAEDLTYDKGYSTWSATGFRCSSGTSINMTTSLQDYNIGTYRIVNLDSADDVYFGHNTSISTRTAAGDSLTGLGERVAAGGSSTWDLGFNIIENARVQIWCKAEDDAGAGGVVVSRAVFGYR